MALISRDVTSRRTPLTWRPGPPTPYSLLPVTRRFEWLALIATPIGGILAVVDKGSAGGICTFLALVAVVLFVVPMAIREGFYRLPLPLAQALFAIVLGAVVMFVLAVAVLLACGDPLVLAVCMVMFPLYGLLFWYARKERPA